MSEVLRVAFEMPCVVFEAPHPAFEAPCVAFEASRIAFEAPCVAFEAPHTVSGAWRLVSQLFLQPRRSSSSYFKRG